MANTRAQKTAQNLSTLTTAGDIAYASAAGTPARLGIGSASQVLTVAAGVPSWATPSGGGKVLQVVSANYGTRVTIATSTFTDTGLTATITPTLNTSKILVLISQFCQTERSGARAYAGWQYMRGATVLNTRGIVAGVYAGGSQSGWNGILSACWLDSPATTSATTYKTQGNAYDTDLGGTTDWNFSFSSTITLLEIGA